ncbi:GAF domain-containing protein [uncultured Roseobacter sp.]|uniref:GAF domain-containing protein n=1 Tax=uncultured Roseobacter sp. TaxID=114847 RepID=UPI002603FF78|nr:GAF domain-containing protein [uncultured Roseobacter sp.]
MISHAKPGPPGSRDAPSGRPPKDTVGGGAGENARIALHLLTIGVDAKAAYLFSARELDLTIGQPAGGRPLLHDDVMHGQALLLSAQVASLYAPLAVDDIYAHPLIRRAEVLSGHRLRAFLGAPIRDADGALLGVMCAIDTVVRRWTAQDCAMIAQIVAQLDLRRLSFF